MNYMRFFNKLNHKMGLLLVPVAFLLWAHSIMNVSIQGISDFGLITALPIAFFVAIGILTFAFLMTLLRKGNQPLLFTQVLLLILFLYLTPLLVEGSRQRFAYSAFGPSDYIIRNGAISPEVVVYQNWPAFQVFTAILKIISGISPDVLVQLGSSIFVELLLLFPLYFFFNTVFYGKQQKWLAVWVFYVGNWITRDYLSSQTLGFLIFALIMTLIVCISMNRRTIPQRIQNSYKSISVVILILYMVVASGHALTSLIPLSILLLFCLAQFFNSKTLLFCVAAMAIAWNLNFAFAYFNANISRFIFSMFDVVNIVQSNLGGSGVYNPIWERILTDQIKISYSVVLLLFGFAGFLLTYRKKALSLIDKMMLLVFSSIWLLSAVLFYGGELFMRLWLFSLPVIAYFIAKNFDSRKMVAVLAIFLMVAPVLLVWTRYGAEKYDYIPPSDRKGAAFLYATVPNGYLVGGNPWGSYLNSYDRLKLIRIDFYNTQNNFTSQLSLELADLQMRGEKWPVYLCINPGETEFYRRLYNTTDIFEKIKTDVGGSQYYCMIYSNPSFDLYVIQSQNDVT